MPRLLITRISGISFTTGSVLVMYNTSIAFLPCRTSSTFFSFWISICVCASFCLNSCSILASLAAGFSRYARTWSISAQLKPIQLSVLIFRPVSIWSEE